MGVGRQLYPWIAERLLSTVVLAPLDRFPRQPSHKPLGGYHMLIVSEAGLEEGARYTRK